MYNTREQERVQNNISRGGECVHVQPRSFTVRNCVLVFALFLVDHSEECSSRIFEHNYRTDNVFRKNL
jgi:hypothetical protein